RNPRHPTYRQFLRNHYSVLAQNLIRQGDHAEAVQAATEFARVFPDRPDDSYQAACFLVQCLRLAAKDTRLPPEGRTQLARSYGDRAVEQLQTALGKGLKDFQRLGKDSALEPLRGRADFQKLVSTPEKAVPSAGGQP